MPDELYHRQLLHTTGHVLATAHSDKPGGTDADEQAIKNIPLPTRAAAKPTPDVAKPQ